MAERAYRAQGFRVQHPLIAMQATAHAGPMPSEHSFLRTSSDNVVVTAMKKAEDTHSLIVHLYEWKGEDHDVELDVPAGATAASETNLMEKPEGDGLQLKANRVTLHVHPFEIVSFRLDYPEKTGAVLLAGGKAKQYHSHPYRSQSPL